MTQLSAHFTDVELEVDGAEERIRQNAINLCITVLEPIRLLAGLPLRITSGYRLPTANAATGGVATSEHLYEGDHAAADFTCFGYPLTKLFQQIRDSGLPFRQAILEYSRDGVVECIHVSTRRGELDKHEALIGQTHGTGGYSVVSCAPVMRMPPDPDGEIAT